MVATKHMDVPINRAAWSPSSQRSAGRYDGKAQAYENIRCPCRACGQSFVLTAAAQQIAFEVEQKYVWWLPSFCAACVSRLADLQGRDRLLQARWNASRDNLRTDRAFIGAWIDVLEGIAQFGKRNACMQLHLQRLL